MTALASSFSPAVDGTPRTARGRFTTRIEPAHLLAVATVAAVLVKTAEPIRDVDVFWRLLVGREVLQRGPLVDLGTGWTLTRTGEWRSPSWLAEAGLVGMYELGGWRVVIVVRGLLAAAILGSIALMLLRRYPPRIGVFCFVPVAMTAAVHVQDRPQLLSFLFVVWWSTQAASLIRDGALPRLVLVVPVTLLWANIHGLWILAPISLGLALICRSLDGFHDCARRGLLILGAVMATGMVTPLGPSGLLLPLQLRSATALITEWQPTQFSNPNSWGLLALFLAAVWTWSRSPKPIPRGEIVYIAGWIGFAALAGRNVFPSAMFIAPIVAHRLRQHFGSCYTVTGRRERQLLWMTGGFILVLSLLVAGTQYARLDPLRNAPALAIARHIAAEPQGPPRVLNDYNAAGVIALFAGSQTQVVIDGRADRYGGARIGRHLAAMAGKPVWREVLDETHPSHVVVRESSPLVEILQLNGWYRVMTDGEYVLLEPTAPSGS